VPSTATPRSLEQKTDHVPESRADGHPREPRATANIKLLSASYLYNHGVFAMPERKTRK